MPSYHCQCGLRVLLADATEAAAHVCRNCGQQGHFHGPGMEAPPAAQAGPAPAAPSSLHTTPLAETVLPASEVAPGAGPPAAATDIDARAGGGAGGRKIRIPHAAGAPAAASLPIRGRSCPRCNTALAADATLCTHCGTDLATGKRHVTNRGGTRFALWLRSQGLGFLVLGLVLLLLGWGVVAFLRWNAAEAPGPATDAPEPVAATATEPVPEPPAPPQPEPAPLPELDANLLRAAVVRQLVAITPVTGPQAGGAAVALGLVVKPDLVLMSPCALTEARNGVVAPLGVRRLEPGAQEYAGTVLTAPGDASDKGAVVVHAPGISGAGGALGARPDLQPDPTTVLAALPRLDPADPQLARWPIKPSSVTAVEASGRNRVLAPELDAGTAWLVLDGEARVVARPAGDAPADGRGCYLEPLAVADVPSKPPTLMRTEVVHSRSLGALGTRDLRLAGDGIRLHSAKLRGFVGWFDLRAEVLAGGSERAGSATAAVETFLFRDQFFRCGQDGTVDRLPAVAGGKELVAEASVKTLPTPDCYLADARGSRLLVWVDKTHQAAFYSLPGLLAAAPPLNGILAVAQDCKRQAFYTFGVTGFMETYDATGQATGRERYKLPANLLGKLRGVLPDVRGLVVDDKVIDWQTGRPLLELGKGRYRFPGPHEDLTVCTPVAGGKGGELLVEVYDVTTLRQRFSRRFPVPPATEAFFIKSGPVASCLLLAGDQNELLIIPNKRLAEAE